MPRVEVPQRMGGLSNAKTAVLDDRRSDYIIASEAERFEAMCETEAGQPVFNTKDRRVCSECVREAFLHEELERNGRDGTCFYCEEDGRTFSIGQIADCVDPVLSEFCYPPERGSGEGRPVADVINDLAKIGPEAAEDVRRVLAERNTEIEQGETDSEGRFDPDAQYVMKPSVDAWDLEAQWFRFESSLKTETRYFNRHGEELMTYIFEGIDGHRTRGGHKIVVEVGPGTKDAVLYRARVFQDEDELRKAMMRPDKDVGPPPAPSAGRMNAAGIAVFYAATDRDAALAEVRPPVGSKVLIGCFEVVRPLMLLDLGALRELGDDEGSHFDQDHVRRLKRAKFLRELIRRISKPVMPDDEILDYLSTQAIADFLATRKSNPPLDGIIYPSVQVGTRGDDSRTFGGSRRKRNVVLFPKAARVQPLEEGVGVSVSDGTLYGVLTSRTLADGPDLKYTVEVASASTSSPELNDVDLDDAPLKLAALEVHSVTSVKFETVSSPVDRDRRVQEQEPE